MAIFRSFTRVVLWAALVGVVFPAKGLQLTPSVNSGQPVGTTIRWSATSRVAMLFQFSVANSSGAFSVVRDFSAVRSFAWTPIDEGQYQIKVVGRPTNSAFGLQQAVQSFSIISRVTGASAVVTATPHPLVALYSAPPCGSGTVFVEFAIAGQNNWQWTNAKPCSSTQSSNFYVAGMLAATTYQMRHDVFNGLQLVRHPLIQFTTGQPTRAFPTFQLPMPANSQSSLAENVVLHSMLDIQNPGISIPVATDLFGRLIWYYDGLSNIPQTFFYVTRPVQGGTLLGLTSCCGGSDFLVAEIDLAGNAVRQTSMSRINTQLAQMGFEQVRAIHHDAVRFPNGQTVVIGMLEHTGPPDILGDMIIALDPNLQVVWAWNAFDHLSTSRGPLLGETCAISYGPACSASSPSAIDWLHSNSLSYSPADHNLIVSLRHQDWVVKLDYRDGQGTGNVIWKLGWEGDFTVQGSSDSYPWFSHQHQVDWQQGSNLITMFDNGNTRCAVTSSCVSRGQVWQLDETNRVATLKVNEYLGVYSNRHGSAQILSNGNYHFSAGYVVPALVNNTFEFTPSGTTVYNLQTEGTEYRTFRMRSLYLE